MSHRSLSRYVAPPFAVLLLGLLTGPLPAQGKGPTPISWEYCEFSWYGERHRVEFANRVVEAKSLLELAEKLGKRTDQNHSTAIINILGEQGWELVTHVVYTDNGVRRYYWTFKRPGVPPLKNP
jgi:hypothetical protein